MVKHQKMKNSMYGGKPYKKKDLQRKIVDTVEATLKGRDITGALENECDYIAGAMAVMQTINVELFNSTVDQSMDIIPPMWIICPASGRSLLDELK